MCASTRHTLGVLDRRAFLGTGMVAAVAGAKLLTPNWPSTQRKQVAFSAPTYSVIPVVGDGKWVWTEPPDDTGYLEPREFELKIGIQIEGTGDAGQIMATTPVPVNFPEQTVHDSNLRTEGCQAIVRPVSKEAAQLVLAASTIDRKQMVAAAVTMKMTLFKQYLGHSAEQFPVKQPKATKEFRQRFLYDSPGIQTRLPEIRKLAKEVQKKHEHPWQQAEAFYAWVRENIRARIGNYTSVKRALRDRVGDCEERAAVFVALCRAADIPARLVWIPNHNWAEFFLVDTDGNGHWIPAHTAAYSWFGWTGAHELVIQKGDRIHVPEKRKPQRLLVDWAQWIGARPKLRYLAELTPLPSGPDEEVGPGARRKNVRGEWELLANHDMDYQLRDGTVARGGS